MTGATACKRAPSPVYGTGGEGRDWRHVNREQYGADRGMSKRAATARTTGPPSGEPAAPRAHQAGRGVDDAPLPDVSVVLSQREAP